MRDVTANSASETFQNADHSRLNVRFAEFSPSNSLFDKSKLRSHYAD